MITNESRLEEASRRRDELERELKSLAESKGDSRNEAIAELDVRPDLWFFQCHFESDPVMPGCLGLDARWQLLGFYLGWTGATGRGRAIAVGGVKLSGQVLPDTRLVRYHLQVRRVIQRKLVLGIADATMAVDGKPIYEASDLRVGLFSAADAFASQQ